MTPRTLTTLLLATLAIIAAILLAMVASLVGWRVVTAILAVAGTVALPLLVAGWVRDEG